jgi:hypothetical protein
MLRLLDGKAAEPPATNRGKALAYADEFVSFFKACDYPSGKLLDQALWSYGKYLKNSNAA